MFFKSSVLKPLNQTNTKMTLLALPSSSFQKKKKKKKGQKFEASPPVVKG
jgi:hypothetical protein